MKKINSLKEKFSKKRYALSPSKRMRRPFLVHLDTIRFSTLNNNVYCNGGLLYDDTTGEDALAFDTKEEALEYFDANFGYSKENT